MKTLLLLVGVRGAGKSTLIESLTSHQSVKYLRATTTRPKHARDRGMYSYRGEGEWNPEEYLWNITVGGHRYGLPIAEWNGLRNGEIGFSQFHPGNIEVLESFRKTSDDEIVTVGIDSVASYESQQERTSHEESRNEGADAFAIQKKVVENCDVVLKGDASTVREGFLSVVRCLIYRGTLDKRSLEALINSGTLLRSAIVENIQAASYDLRVGDRVWCKGRTIDLAPGRTVAIPPYSYMIVKAEEHACLPRFITAHYDLKVSLFIEGIILSNGPQVDPGFKGGLLCMMFNASDRNVGIRRGEHFATVEFSVTTRVTEGYHAEHQGRGDLADYVPSTIAESSGGTIADRFDALASSWENFRNIYIAATLATIVGLFAAYWPIYQSAKDSTEKAQSAVAEAQRATDRLSIISDDALWRKDIETELDALQHQVLSGIGAVQNGSSNSKETLAGAGGTQASSEGTATGPRDNRHRHTAP